MFTETLTFFLGKKKKTPSGSQSPSVLQKWYSRRVQQGLLTPLAKKKQPLPADSHITPSTGGSSRLQRERPKPANAVVIQVHQVYIGKVRFRKGANRILALLNLNLARFAPPPPGSASELH